MSEKADAVRRVVDAINRVDLDGFADAVSEDFEIDFSNSRGPMSGVYRGPRRSPRIPAVVPRAVGIARVRR